MGCCMVNGWMMNDSESFGIYVDSKVETENKKYAVCFCSCGDDDEVMRMGSEMINGERTSRAYVL